MLAVKRKKTRLWGYEGVIVATDDAAAAVPEDGDGSDDGDGEDGDGSDDCDNTDAPISWHAFLSSIGLVELSDFVSARYEFALASDERDPKKMIGFLNYLGGDILNQKCICKTHSKCTLWVKAKGEGMSGAQLMRDIVVWLSQGHACSEAEHQMAAYHCKIKYGMSRAKKPTP